MDDHQLRELLESLGYSWRGYRKVRKGVRKRIHRHMHELGCPNLKSYLETVKRNAAEKRCCQCLLTVSISRFFRDRKLWESIDHDIFSPLVPRAGETLRAWSAGCACGEEAYSLKILWHRHMMSVANPPRLEVLASDLNPRYLEKARLGVYPLSSMKEVPPALQHEYFLPGGDSESCAVVEFLKEGITWMVHDLFSTPPRLRFELIFLRNNLLTYYEGLSQGPVLRRVLTRLSPGGILVIGSHERLPPEELGLVPYGSLPYVFQNRVRMS